ncbi:MAG: TlpA family protein disulfide reductase, partial [Bacteroidetes bacterium]|nr:TlpA family protein disulfide reductase [Bacteroidota bacterium]
MSSLKHNFKKVPGWVYMLIVFGFLYFTGLHTEVIGQIQRLLLATGLRNADVPKSGTVTYPTQKSTSQPLAGQGFMLAGLDGQPFPFENLRGKVVFLNLWATWCP